MDGRVEPRRLTPETHRRMAPRAKQQVLACGSERASKSEPELDPGQDRLRRETPGFGDVIAVAQAGDCAPQIKVRAILGQVSNRHVLDRLEAHQGVLTLRPLCSLLVV